MEAKESKNWWDQMVSLGATVVRKAKYGTVLDTILVVIVIVTPLCLIGYLRTGFWPLIIIGIAPILHYIRAYEYFMKNDPKMLRSEGHEERMFRIATGLGSQGNEIAEKTIDGLKAVTATGNKNSDKPKLLKGTVVRTNNHE